jgi:hypothetical protein
VVELRPLIIVTGRIRTEGGESDRVRKQPGSTRRTRSGDGHKVVVVHEKVVTDARRKADVITTGYARRFQHLRLLWTPFGALVDPKDLDKVKGMLLRASTDVAEFNRTYKESQLANCYLYERLAGNRLEAVRGWIDRRVVEHDEAVIAALPTFTAADKAA